MKKYIIISVILASLFSGCSDPHVYNTEADKKCEAQLQTSTNLNELLLFALKQDASPSTIKKILKQGASAATTVGKEEIPIICYAKSPKAIKIVYKAHPENQEKKGPSEVLFNKSLNTPLFHYQSPELCEAYFERVVLDVDYGDYEINIDGEVKKFSLTMERVLKKLLDQKDNYERGPLFYAKTKDMVNYWIDRKGRNLNIADKYGNNVLGYNIKNGNEDIEFLKHLIAKGADVNFGIDKGKATPLVIAIANNGSKELIELLIAKGADVNAGEDKENITPLGYALLHNKGKDIIELLISKGAKVENIATTSNLFYCVQTPEHVQFLKGKGLSPDIATQYGFYIKVGDNKYVAQTPLAKAVGQKLSLNTIQALIDAGADVSQAFLTLGKLKISAYNFAVTVLKDNNIADLLLKNGAVKSCDIGTVLGYFAEEGNVKMVSELLNLGVSIDNSSKSIDKVFDLLLESGDVVNLKKLIANGCDINKKEIEKHTSRFSDGTLSNKIKKFDIFIELGYDVNRRNENGKNILDEVMNDFNSINLGTVSRDSFELIVKNTTALKDRGYANDKLKEILSEKNLRTEILEAFLKNCTAIDQNILRSALISSLDDFSSVNESAIITLVKHIDDLNDKIQGKTLIGYALEYKNISLEIIKAISEKMYFPNTPTAFRYGENKQPSEIAKELGRNDIAEFLGIALNDGTIIDKDGKIKILGLYIGMSKKEYERVIKFYYGESIADVKFDKYDKLIFVKFKDNNKNWQKEMFSRLELESKLAKEEYLYLEATAYLGIDIAIKNFFTYKTNDYVIIFSEPNLYMTTTEHLGLKALSAIESDFLSVKGKLLKKSNSEYNKETIEWLKRYRENVRDKDKNKINKILNNLDNVDKIFESFK